MGDLPAPIAEALQRILGEIEGDDNPEGFARAGGPSHRVAVPYQAGVLPWMVWVVLAMVLDVPRFGRHEKLAWEFVLRFRGVPMTMAHEKFGLRAYVDGRAVDDEEGAGTLVADLIAAVERAVPLVEKHVLTDLVTKQLNGGQVTVDNVYPHLWRGYEHFRTRSENPHVPEEEPPTMMETEFGIVYSGKSRAFEVHEASRFDRAAAVNAYVSALEHLLVHAFAFSNLDPAGGRLERFIGSTWREKWKTVVDLSEPGAKRCYDALISLVEGVRHPASHGGFDHQRNLIYFHIPDLGAVPVQMSGAGTPDHFLFSSQTGEKGNEPWTILDEVDEWIASGPLRFAHEWAVSGLDMPFDPDFRAQLQLTMKDDEEFDHFLEGYSRHIDDAMNMDW